ncbi:MAG: acyltransferase [Desulfovibrio sp.]
MTLFNRLRSLFWTWRLRLGGAEVGGGLRVEGPLRILLRDGASLRNLSIGHGVALGGTVYLRMRAGGRVRLGDRVALGTEVWLVTANNALLELGDNVQVGSYCLLNGGHGLSIGADSWLAGFVYLNSSDHGIEPGRLIREQGYVGAAIVIGPDNWLGGHSFICKGVRTGRGVVVGAGAVVTKSFEDNAIVAGNPARILRHRGEARKEAFHES